MKQKPFSLETSFSECSCLRCAEQNEAVHIRTRIINVKKEVFFLGQIRTPNPKTKPTTSINRQNPKYVLHRQNCVSLKCSTLHWTEEENGKISLITKVTLLVANTGCGSVSFVIFKEEQDIPDTSQSHLLIDFVPWWAREAIDRS